MQEIAEAAVAMGRAVELTREAAASVAATVDELRALQVGQNRTLVPNMHCSHSATVRAIERGRWPVPVKDTGNLQLIRLPLWRHATL